MKAAILQPVVVLIIWTLVMQAWMYATRIPAMRKAGTVLDPNVPGSVLTGQLPPAVRWKADNYNHLMEQPTIFYAVALAIALAGGGGDLSAKIAWGYVGLRIVHSLIQVIVNRIMVRFVVFNLATLCLAALAWHAARLVFG